MNIFPQALARSTNGDLEITWSDGQQQRLTVKALRDACPCATCREKRTAANNEPPPLFQVLKPEETRPLALASMRPVGNYAYAIAFSDGHDTGIYSFELLHSIGR